MRLNNSDMVYIACMFILPAVLSILGMILGAIRDYKLSPGND